MNIHRNRIFGCCIILLAVVACGNTGNRNGDATVYDKYTKGLMSKTICSLKENLDFIDRSIEDFDIISDSTFILSNASRVYIYNLDGSQISKIGQTGRASGEYISANAVYKTDNYIYVWCSSTLKLLRYNLSGKFDSEYIGINTAIQDFVVVDDKIVYLYGNSEQGVVTAYDLSSGKTVSTTAVPNEIDNLLLFNKRVSGIGAYDNGAIFSLPSKLNIKYMVNNRVEDLFKIDDQHYNINQKENKDQKIVRKGLDIAEIAKFGWENATLLKLHSYNGSIYIVAEVGSFSLGQYSQPNRKIALYSVDKDLEPLQKKLYDYPDNAVVVSYSLHKGQLYALTADENEEYNVILFQ